jgi:hypothetical protein
MTLFKHAALLLGLILVSVPRLSAQQLDSAQRRVWQTVEARWQAWQAADLEKMLQLYHPRFHAWNRVTGRVDNHDSMMARWKSALETERILAVKLEPVAVEVFADFATAYYVSRETVQRLSPMRSATDTSPRGVGPTVVSIRWTDYLVRQRGRWLFVAYNGVPCTESEAAGSLCRSPTEK